MYRSPFNVPVRITGGFPYYDSDGLKDNSHGSHTGQDMVVLDKEVESNWQVFAIDDGVVTTVSSAGGYGNHMTYSTSDGRSVLVAHLKNKPIFRVGAELKKGEYIGMAGNTGNLPTELEAECNRSTGRHLHIEIQDSPKWVYGENLLKPSLYINFCDHSSEKEKEIDMPKTWINGTTKELVYQTISDCNKKCNSIGYLSPHEICECYGIIDDVYLVVYDVGNSGNKKCGYVSYHGGVK